VFVLQGIEAAGGVWAEEDAQQHPTQPALVPQLSLDEASRREGNC